MKLSVSMIVKNESSCLAKCLESVKGADELIVVDTGSTDNTKEIAALYGAKIYDFPWIDDFAAARNYSLQQCTGDFIFIIDADWTLAPGGMEKIRKATENAPANIKTINVNIETPTGTHKYKQPLLFRRCPEVFWKGAIHNYLSVKEDNPSDIVIYPGYSAAHKLDPDRTLRILLKELDKNPNLLREKYYLAREYLYRKNYPLAVEWYEKYLVNANWMPERADAHLSLARCYWQLRKGEDARRQCLQAISNNANFKEALLFMAELSWPKNAIRWREFAEHATNEDVLFERTCAPTIKESETVTVKYGTRTYKFSGPPNDHIFKSIRRAGFYELDLLHEIQAMSLSGTYVDVGANIGNHTVFFSLECAAKRVIAIEPQPEALQYLVKNVVANDVFKTSTVVVEFINCAVSDVPGRGAMCTRDDNNLGMARLEAGDSVSIKTLDDILKDIAKVTLIKIDVEGRELQALRGAKETLLRCYPVLAVEATDIESQEAIRDFLDPLGYSVKGPFGATPTWIWSKQGVRIPREAVLATLYVRRETAAIAVASISPQVDRVHVVLNRVGSEDLDEWKRCFPQSNVAFYIRDNDLGDAERYWPVGSDPAYYLSIDDDLVYPPQYVSKMVAGCYKYDCPVSLHGKFFPMFPVDSYSSQAGAHYYQCLNELSEDKAIHFPGSGVACWRSDQIDLSHKQFKVKNQADIEVGRIAAEAAVPLMCLKHSPLEYMPPKGKTIWEVVTSANSPALLASVNGVLELRQ